jgi:hypothetical protein
MTPEKFQELRELYIEHVSNVVTTTGGMFPHITVIADDKDNAASMIHIPLPDEFMANNDTKDEFIDRILPEIVEKLHKDEFTPHAVAWTSECWMRVIPKEDQDKLVTGGWQSFPKKEIVFVSIETADKTDVITYDIIRKGMKVDKEGDMIEDVELKENSPEENPGQINGRFSQLFNKFRKK